MGLYGVLQARFPGHKVNYYTAMLVGEIHYSKAVRATFIIKYLDCYEIGYEK